MGMTITTATTKVKSKKIEIDPQEWRDYRVLTIFVRQNTDNCDEAILKKWLDQRNSFVARYYYLVYREAEKMHEKNQHVEVDEMASWGVDGLYDAVDNYDVDKIEEKSGKTVKFETFGPYRIKGAILDHLRKNDDVPRLTRQRAKKIKDKKKELEAKYGRPPTDEEMAQGMNLTIEMYEKIAKAAQVKNIHSLDNVLNGDDSEGEMSMMDCICDTRQKDPLELMVQDELRSKLMGKHFTKAEQKIIFCYYDEDRSMKEIADMLNISESRVSQMHTKIIDRLRDIIVRNPNYFGPNAKKWIEAAKTKGK